MKKIEVFNNSVENPRKISVEDVRRHTQEVVNDFNMRAKDGEVSWQNDEKTGDNEVDRRNSFFEKIKKNRACLVILDAVKSVAVVAAATLVIASPFGKNRIRAHAEEGLANTTSVSMESDDEVSEVVGDSAGQGLEIEEVEGVEEESDVNIESDAEFFDESYLEAPNGVKYSKDAYLDETRDGRLGHDFSNMFKETFGDVEATKKVFFENCKKDPKFLVSSFYALSDLEKGKYAEMSEARLATEIDGENGAELQLFMLKAVKESFDNTDFKFMILPKSTNVVTQYEVRNQGKNSSPSDVWYGVADYMTGDDEGFVVRISKKDGSFIDMRDKNCANLTEIPPSELETAGYIPVEHEDIDENADSGEVNGSKDVVEKDEDKWTNEEENEDKDEEDKDEEKDEDEEKDVDEKEDKDEENSDAKNPEEIEKNMQTHEESTNRVTPMGPGELSDRPVTDDPDNQYDRNTNTFGDVSPKPGTGDTDNDGVVNSGKTQTGGYDTNLKSADGSGKTIKEIIESADTSTLNEFGQKVNELINRTVEDAKKVAKDEAAKLRQEKTNQEQQKKIDEAKQREEEHKKQQEVIEAAKKKDATDEEKEAGKKAEKERGNEQESAMKDLLRQSGYSEDEIKEMFGE